MATLVNGTTLNADLTITKQTGTKITFDTDQKYVPKDIEINLSAQTASPSFTGGALGDKSASATFTNMTTSTTNSSGVVIATSGGASRGAVTYNGAVDGWVTKTNGANALSAGSSENWNGTTYYATGVTLTNGTQFNITVPDGNSTATHTISVDSEGNVTGITSASGAAITIWDEEDTNGGIIRHIEAVDLSSDTITAGHLEYGYTAHDAQGNPIVGTLTTGGGTPTLQAKTNITPTESSQTITADNGYDGLSSVQINAISSTYVGSGITSRSSTDLEASGATVTVPAGYYSTQATKAISSGSVTNSGTASASSATVSTGTNTLTLSKAVSITPSVTAGYISSGTAGNVTVSLTASITTKGTTTYTPTTSNQTIASGTYLTGAQTISGDANLVAGNIKNGVTIFGVTGSYTGASVSLQAKTGITPTESSQTITADNGYDGLSSVQINAISSTYVGSGITSRSSSDLTASGATVTVPAGYYSTQATKSVSSLTLPTSASASATSGYTSKATISPSTSDQYINIGTGYNSTTSYYKISAMTTMTLPTSAAASATSGYTSKATISRSTSDQYINIPTGYNSAGAYYKISAVANGSATGPSSLSGTSATVSTGTNTITLTKTGVTTTPTVSAGYVSSATASTATVTLTASVTTKAATTYHPSTSDQTIASGTYTTGTQTIKAVTVSGLNASSILSGTTVKIGDSTDDDCVTSVSGSVTFQTYYTGSSTPSSSTGVNGDIYLKTS